MRQFVLPPEYAGEGHCTLRGEQRHYIVNVLRLKEGERFPGLDRTGNPFELELESVDARQCRLAVHPAAPQELGRSPGEAKITLFQCLPKGKKMELIIRQATEAGISTIVPVTSRHSVPRLDRRDFAAKSERWSRIVREAVQQCGRGSFPELRPPISFDELPEAWSRRGTGLFFHEEPLAQKSLHEYLVEDAGEVALVIGPEGGLAPSETQVLLDAGFGAVFLGANVLRVETATLFAIAAARIILLEKSRWRLNNR